MNSFINLTNHGDEFYLYDEFHQGHERNQGYQFNKANFFHYDEGINLYDIDQKCTLSQQNSEFNKVMNIIKFKYQQGNGFH